MAYIAHATYLNSWKTPEEEQRFYHLENSDSGPPNTEETREFLCEFCAKKEIELLTTPDEKLLQEADLKGLELTQEIEKRLERDLMLEFITLKVQCVKLRMKVLFSSNLDNGEIIKKIKMNTDEEREERKAELQPILTQIYVPAKQTLINHLNHAQDENFTHNWIKENIVSKVREQRTLPRIKKNILSILLDLEAQKRSQQSISEPLIDPNNNN